MGVNIKLGLVVSVDDDYEAGRIKVKFIPQESDKDIDVIPYAYPLLPKMFNVLPKTGELVLVFLTQSGDNNSIRFYIGPLISQLHHLEKEDFNSAHGIFPSNQDMKSRLDRNPRRHRKKDNDNLGTDPEDDNIQGAWGENEDIVIYGRKGTDIILKENDIRVRCGSRVDGQDKFKVFNGSTSAYLKLKYNKDETVVKTKYNGTEIKYNSTANLVADQINLIGNHSDLRFTTGDKQDLLSDETIKLIIEKAHALPYGDTLVTFLKEFLTMFKEHSHNWVGHTTILPSGKETFWEYIRDDKLDGMLLSKSVRIN